MMQALRRKRPTVLSAPPFEVMLLKMRPPFVKEGVGQKRTAVGQKASGLLVGSSPLALENGPANKTQIGEQRGRENLPKGSRDTEPTFPKILRELQEDRNRRGSCMNNHLDGKICKDICLCHSLLLLSR